MESIFACAKALEHVVAGCIARVDRRGFLSIAQIDFNRIEQSGFLLERNPLAMYQCFSRKLSSHVPTDGMMAVQYHVSPSTDAETKIGHRSNYLMTP